MSMFYFIHLFGTFMGFIIALLSAIIVFTHGFLSPITPRAASILKQAATATLATLLLVWGTAFLHNYELNHSFLIFGETEIEKAKTFLIVLVTLNSILFSLHYAEQLAREKHVPFLKNADIASIVVIATSLCMALATWLTLIVLTLHQAHHISVNFERVMDTWFTSNLVSVSLVLMLIALYEFHNEKQHMKKAGNAQSRTLKRFDEINQ